MSSDIVYGELPPDVQPPMYEEPPKRGSLLGNPFMTVVMRSAQIFAFWFIIMVILGFIYNEVVVSETMRRWTGNPSHVEYESEEEAAVMDTDFDKYRYDNHQILSFAASVAGVMLLTRFFLEALCFYAGKEVCANVSGQAIYAESAYGQDQQPVVAQPAQQQQMVVAQPQPVMQQAPQPMTRAEMLAPSDGIDGSSHHGQDRRRHRRY